MIEHGLRVEEAAHAAGVSVRTAYKWLRRYREEGLSGLQDRSSRPACSPRATPLPVVEQVMELRRQRKTYREIALILPVGLSTIARLMRRAGLHRLAELEPARPDNRYEYPQAGDLLHLDIKKLGRFWRPGHRVTGNRQGACEGPAGSSSTWPSTIIPVSPSAPSRPMSGVSAPAGPCCRRCATTVAWGSPSPGS